MLARYGFAALAVSMAAVVYRYDLLAVVRSGRYSKAVKVHEEDSRKTLPKKPNVLKDQPTTNNKGDEGLGKGSFTSFASIAERDHLKATLQYHQLKSMKADNEEDQHTMDHRYTCLDYIKASALDGTDEEDITNVMSGRMDDGEDCCSYVTGPHISASDKRLYSIAISVCNGAAVDFGGFGGFEMPVTGGGPGGHGRGGHGHGTSRTTGRSRPPRGGGGGGGASECPCKGEYVVDDPSYCDPPLPSALPGDDDRLLTDEKVKMALQKANPDCFALYVKNVVGKGHTRGRGVNGS